MNPEKAAEIALETAISLGATYGDMRICRLRNEQIHTREQRVKEQSFSYSEGFGVRVLVNRSWGFGASAITSEQELKRVATLACQMARTLSSLPHTPIELAATEPVTASWATPLTEDPFKITPREKIDLLFDLNQQALKYGATYCDSFLWSSNEWKYFASSEGSRLTQNLFRIWCQAIPTVIDASRGKFETRATLAPPLGGGYELIRNFPFAAEIERATSHAQQKLHAPTVAPGDYDLILHPSHLWLTIHETCGHATELDRAMGYEANYAGTSFITPEKRGNLKYGSDLVTIIGNRNEVSGLATCAYDDEGVKTREFPIIQNGVFVNYQTSREHAAMLGDSHSCGCAYADSWCHAPLQRMPNISLQPNKNPYGLSQLISDTDEGILIIGDGSWSIDQQRQNFQFTGQEFWKVKNGKLQGMLRDVAYQGSTTDFWNSCDAICDASEYQLHGSFFCGKGQPAQLAPVSHGSSPARFRKVRVFATDRTLG